MSPNPKSIVAFSLSSLMIIIQSHGDVILGLIVENQSNNCSCGRSPERVNDRSYLKSICRIDKYPVMDTKSHACMWHYQKMVMFTKNSFHFHVTNIDK